MGPGPVQGSGLAANTNRTSSRGTSHEYSLPSGRHGVPSAISPLILAIALGLGEATHGTREFFQFQHRFFEFMVHEMGVRTRAFEGSQSAAETVVDAYVQGGPGEIEAVVASLGLVGGWEETTAAQPLPLGDCPDQIYR